MASFTTAAPGSPEQTIPFSFDVKEDASVVWPGEKAPSVDTPTLADVGGDVAKISSDEDPVEAFYETSVADALAANKPFVLVFATPKFCQTKTCGPTLEKIKTVAAAHPDMTFINVEPYLLEDVDGPAPARPRRERPAPGRAGDPRVRPPRRAVRLRRRRRGRRHRTRSSWSSRPRRSRRRSPAVS